MATEFFTRLQLKYDSYENWSDTTVTGQKGNLVLLAGEIGICTIPSTAKNSGVQDPPHIMFKVGDGKINEDTGVITGTAFKDLPWASAKAADVYAWAKQDKVTVEAAGTGNVVASIEWNKDLNDGKGGIKYTTASVATSQGLKDLQDALAALTKRVENLEAAIEAMDADFDVAEGNYITGITQVNGKITAIDQKALPTNADTVDGKHASDFATAEQGGKADTAMQSIKVLGHTLEDGDELTVAEGKTALGLKSAAYTESSAYATAAQGILASTAVQPTAIADMLTKTEAQNTYVPKGIVAGTIAGNGDNAQIPTTKAVADYVKNATASLTGAMHFIGKVDALPASANAGDVYLVGNKEYVWDGTQKKFVELGDEGSLATGDQVNAALAEAKKYTDDEIAELGLGDMSKETAANYVKKTEAPGYNDILTKAEAANTYVSSEDIESDNLSIDGTKIPTSDLVKKYVDDQASNYATSEQGGKADTAIQTITDSATGQIFKKSGTTVTAQVDKDLATNTTSNVSIPTSKAVADHVNARIATLDYTDTPVDGQFVTEVNQVDGKISVTRSNITLDKVAANTKANYVIFNCGSSTEVI